MNPEQGDEDLESPWAPTQVWLRTRNDAANHLGLPLPSGQVAVFASAAGTRLLLKEAPLRDLALNEEVEIDLGKSADVQARCIPTQIKIDPAHNRTIPLLPGVVSLRISERDVVRQVEISNCPRPARRI